MTPKDFSSQWYLEKHKAWFYVIFAPLSCTIVVPRWQRSKSLVVTPWRGLSTGNLATWLTRVRRDVCILRLCTRLAFPSQWLLLRSSAQTHAPMQWCPQARRRMSTLKIDYMEMILPGIYDSIATVGEIRVYRRADFQSGSRVLKKVFWTLSYLYLWHTMWFHAKKLLKTLKF